MRPFKMFFALSIGVILFFFVAKVLLIAFVAAAILTLVFGALRRIKYHMQSRYEERYFDEEGYSSRNAFSQYRRRSPLFYDDDDELPLDRLAKVHYVEVR